SGLPSYSQATKAWLLRTSARGRFVVYPPSEYAITKAADGWSSTASSSVSTLTPRQRMSRWVHFVTQLMSTTQSRAGRAVSSSHDHRTGAVTRPSIVSDHRSSGVRGVGPADRTGKSRVRYCPGGVLDRASP